MKTEEYPIEDNKFEYMGKTYDCSYGVERDIPNIIREAETSHKEHFEETYVKESLKPYKIRLHLDRNEEPLFCMILYVIDYKRGISKRTACGDYYQIYNGKVFPHPFQASICW